MKENTNFSFSLSFSHPQKLHIVGRENWGRRMQFLIEFSSLVLPFFPYLLRKMYTANIYFTGLVSMRSITYEAGKMFSTYICTAIPYRASTRPEQGFPCVVFPRREKPVFNTRFPCDENRIFPVRNTTQGKPCFHYRDGSAVHVFFKNLVTFKQKSV